MGSNEEQRAALYQKIKELGSVSHSDAVHKILIVVEGANYAEELKQKVGKLDEDITSSNEATSIPMKVTVETVDKGFRINVFSEEDCPGLLVSILEAFEELGLDVRDDNISCYRRKIILGNIVEEKALGMLLKNEGHVENIDAQVVKRAVLEAIKNWSNSNSED